MTSPGSERDDRPGHPGPSDPLDDDRTVAADDLPEDLDALLAGHGDDVDDDRTMAAEPLPGDAGGQPDRPRGPAGDPAVLDDDRTVEAADLPADLAVPSESSTSSDPGDDPWIRPAPLDDDVPPGSDGLAPGADDVAPGSDDLAPDHTDHTVDAGSDHPVVAPEPARPEPGADDERWHPPSRTGGALVTGSTRSWPVWLVPAVVAVVVGAIVALVVLS